MKKFALLICLSSMTWAQSIVQGNWTGVLHQKASSVTPFTEYKFSMKITENNGLVSGTSTIMVGPNFGVLEFTGTFKNNKLNFQETKIVREGKETGGFDWCYKGGVVSLKKIGDDLILEGAWEGYTLWGATKNPCMPGTFRIVKEVGFISLKGFTVNEAKKPLGSEIQIKAMASGKQHAFIQCKSGEFDVKLPGKEVYELTVTAPGYITNYERVELLESKIVNIVLKPIVIGEKVPLQHILFKRATDTLTSESMPELERLVRFLNDNPTVKIELQGHTSNEGNPADNLKLSEQRVLRIKEYLISKGIKGTRLNTKAFGGSRPMVKNDTEEHRMQNRRVEYLILEK
ncbi:MAG: OmpA family protein [Cytophagaceae bacterium]|jgi:outer membrane protein OmpA-like peptidoglycan-associated protein|nr:OmpA family protein [Cytophagaceae bacterium]